MASKSASSINQTHSEIEPTSRDQNDDLLTSSLSSVVSLAGLMLRSKVIAWVALFITIRGSVMESNASFRSTSNIFVAMLALVMSYLDYLVV